MTAIQLSSGDVTREFQFDSKVGTSRENWPPKTMDKQVETSEMSEMDTSEQYERNPLIYGCDDVWTWNIQQKSADVKLYGHSFKTAHFHPNWSSGTAGVRGTKVLNNGRFFWELRLSQRIFGTSMMFGVGTMGARLYADNFTNLLGEDICGWGLSHKGLLWHGGKWYNYTKPFRENESTTVGILFDGIDGTLTYYKDGKCLGVAFRGLNEIKENLYPMICSTAAKTEMTLACTKREFVNLQDRCRAIIIKNIRNKCDINDLFMPTSIKQYLLEAAIEFEVQPFQSMGPHKPTMLDII